MASHNQIGATKRITSSSGPKFDDNFLVDLRVLYKFWTWNCSARSSNQNQNNFTFAICTKHVNQQRVDHQNMAYLKKLHMDLLVLFQLYIIEATISQNVLKFLSCLR